MKCKIRWRRSFTLVVQAAVMLLIIVCWWLHEGENQLGSSHIDWVTISLCFFAFKISCFQYPQLGINIKNDWAIYRYAPIVLFFQTVFACPSFTNKMFLQKWLKWILLILVLNFEWTWNVLENNLILVCVLINPSEIMWRNMWRYIWCHVSHVTWSFMWHQMV